METTFGKFDKIAKFNHGVGNATIQRTGLRFYYLNYHSKELYELRKKLLITSKQLKVEFRYNPNDQGYVFVFDLFQSNYITVPCVELDSADGLSVDAHVRIIQLLGNKSAEHREQDRRMKMFDPRIKRK